MRAVAFGLLGYGGLMLLVALVLGAIGYSTLHPGAANPNDNYFVGAYLVLVFGLASAPGFALATALFPEWRNQSRRAAFVLGFAGGLLAILLAFLHLGGLAIVLLPQAVLRAWPQLAALLAFSFNGLLAGAAMGLVARLWDKART